MRYGSNLAGYSKASMIEPGILFWTSRATEPIIPVPGVSSLARATMMRTHPQSGLLEVASARRKGRIRKMTKYIFKIQQVAVETVDNQQEQISTGGVMLSHTF